MTDRNPPHSHPNQWTEARGEGLPSLHLEDISGIPFVSAIPGIEEYQHRARVRAGDGDLFAAVTPSAPGYEAYCQNTLGLGAPTMLLAEPTGGPLDVADACAQGTTLEALARVARDAGGLIVHPYMSIQPVWELAAAIKAASGAPTYVLGPTPHALWLANDKRSLDALIHELGMGEFVVETRVEHTPEAIAERAREFAGRFPHVGLKRTRCASAMGNEVFASADLLALSPEESVAHVRAFLERTEWEPGEEVLVVEWADTNCSPSTQLWIPSLESGLPPRLDGVYEQLLEGVEKVFLGSRPSVLPEAVNTRLADASLRVAAAFQAQGYVGRCSFDFIVVGDLEDEPRVCFTECNGRWGGTSTPMRLVDRLMRGAPRPHYIAQDVVHDSLIGADFSELVRALGDDLYDPATKQGRFALYNPGPLGDKGKIDVVSIGATPEEALEGVQVTLPKLWGLG